MSYYNLTGLFESTNPIKLITYANNTLEGTLFGGLIISIFIIMLFALKRYDFGAAFISSSFVCMILSGIGAAAGLFKLFFPLAFFVMFIFSGLYLFMTRRD